MRTLKKLKKIVPILSKRTNISPPKRTIEGLTSSPRKPFLGTLLLLLTDLIFKEVLTESEINVSKHVMIVNNKDMNKNPDSNDDPDYTDQTQRKVLAKTVVFLFM